MGLGCVGDRIVSVAAGSRRAEGARHDRRDPRGALRARWRPPTAAGRQANAASLRRAARRRIKESDGRTGSLSRVMMLGRSLPAGRARQELLRQARRAESAWQSGLPCRRSGLKKSGRNLFGVLATPARTDASNRTPAQSATHLMSQAVLQRLQCVGRSNALANSHCCCSLLHCAVTCEMMSSVSQREHTGVARAA